MTRVDKCEYKGIRYMLWYPKNYIEGKKYPTLFHLHGAGSRGNNFETFEGSSSVLFKVLEKASLGSGAFLILPSTIVTIFYSTIVYSITIIYSIRNAQPRWRPDSRSLLR